MYQAVNNTKTEKSIGGYVLFPGQSRAIEENDVAEALAKGIEVPDFIQEAPAPAPPEPPPSMTMAQFRELPIVKIKEGFETLTDKQLLELEDLEKNAELPRETLLKEFEKEFARRSPTPK